MHAEHAAWSSMQYMLITQRYMRAFKFHSLRPPVQTLLHTSTCGTLYLRCFSHLHLMYLRCACGTVNVHDTQGDFRWCRQRTPANFNGTCTTHVLHQNNTIRHWQPQPVGLTAAVQLHNLTLLCDFQVYASEPRLHLQHTCCTKTTPSGTANCKLFI
jgi:hypothetical protein